MGQLNSSRSGKPEIAMSQTVRRRLSGVANGMSAPLPKAGQRKMRDCG